MKNARTSGFISNFFGILQGTFSVEPLRLLFFLLQMGMTISLAFKLFINTGRKVVQGEIEKINGHSSLMERMHIKGI